LRISELIARDSEWFFIIGFSLPLLGLLDELDLVLEGLFGGLVLDGFGAKVGDKGHGFLFLQLIDELELLLVDHLTGLPLLLGLHQVHTVLPSIVVIHHAALLSRVLPQRVLVLVLAGGWVVSVGRRAYLG